MLLIYRNPNISGQVGDEMNLFMKCMNLRNPLGKKKKKHRGILTLKILNIIIVVLTSIC